MRWQKSRLLHGGAALQERASERVRGDKYRQPNDGAASEVDDVVDGDHLQVQHHLPRTPDGPGQHQCCAHIAGLL